MSAIITDDDRVRPSFSVLGVSSPLGSSVAVVDGGGDKEGRGWSYEGFGWSSKESAEGLVKVRPVETSSPCECICCWWSGSPLMGAVKYAARLC